MRAFAVCLVFFSELFKQHSLFESRTTFAESMQRRIPLAGSLRNRLVTDTFEFLRSLLVVLPQRFDVIMTYLTPNQLERRVPKFEMLKPGSQIVSHHFAMPGVKAAETYDWSASDGQNDKIHLWTTPLSRK